MCLRCRVRCSISLSSFPSVSVCGIRRIFFVFMVFFGTSSNVVVSTTVRPTMCKRRRRVHRRHRVRCPNPLVVVLSRTAARWCGFDVAMYTQTRRWWPSNGCCLLVRVSRTCVDLARRRRVHRRHRACRPNPLVVVRLSQPGSCAWLSTFLLCADCTCVLVCVCLCMCMRKCVGKVINI